jgi:hypothetical protein
LGAMPMRIAPRSKRKRLQRRTHRSITCGRIRLLFWSQAIRRGRKSRKIMEYVERLANKVRIDNVGRNKICLRERTGIHHPKRPVSYWAKEGPPNTGKRSEHIVLTRKPYALTSRSGNTCSPALRLQRVRNALLTCVVRCLA